LNSGVFVNPGGENEEIQLMGYLFDGGNYQTFSGTT
jgi:hypothetical protein